MTRPRRRPDRPSGPACASSASSGERRHEDRLATEEPLEIRLAWPGAAAASGLGDDADARATTSSWPPAGWCTRGSSPLAPRAIAYCTDDDLTPEQEFNVVTVTLDVPPARDPGHRHAGSGSSACGVCGKDSIAEALAAPASGAVGRAAARPGRRTPPAGPAARAAGGLRRAPAACTRRPWPPRTASCSSSARTSAGTTPSTR